MRNTPHAIHRAGFEGTGGGTFKTSTIYLERNTEAAQDHFYRDDDQDRQEDHAHGFILQPGQDSGTEQGPDEDAEGDGSGNHGVDVAT